MSIQEQFISPKRPNSWGCPQCTELNNHMNYILRLWSVRVPAKLCWWMDYNILPAVQGWKLLHLPLSIWSTLLYLCQVIFLLIIRARQVTDIDNLEWRKKSFLEFHALVLSNILSNRKELKILGIKISKLDSLIKHRLGICGNMEKIFVSAYVLQY